MKHLQSGLSLFLTTTLLGGAVFGLAPESFAQTQTQTYTLDNLWLLPDVSHPGAPAEQMTGIFEWTYPVGQFENGIGTFTSLNIPWYGTDIDSLDIVIDLGTLEFVLPAGGGNSLDITLFLQVDLDPSQLASLNLNLSEFEIQEFGVTHQGHMTSGAVRPDDPMSLMMQGTCPSLQFQILHAASDSQVALLRSAGLASFIIPNGLPCAGTLLGLDSPVALVTFLQADASGQVVFQAQVPAGACGTVWIQALDLETCRTSNTLLVQ